MLTLFLNAASNEGCIALCTDDVCIATIPISSQSTAEQIIQALQDVCTKNQYAWTDVQRLSVVIGPGGFSSLRVAVTIMNVLHTIYHIPIAGIHLSDLLAAQIPTDIAECYWLHSTKKTLIFYRNIVSKTSESVCVSTDELATLLPMNALYCGELTPEHVLLFSAKQLQKVELQPLATVLSQLLGNCTYEQKPVAPWYGREG